MGSSKSTRDEMDPDAEVRPHGPVPRQMIWSFAATPRTQVSDCVCSGRPRAEKGDAAAGRGPDLSKAVDEETTTLVAVVVGRWRGCADSGEASRGGCLAGSENDGEKVAVYD